MLSFESHPLVFTWADVVAVVLVVVVVVVVRKFSLGRITLQKAAEAALEKCSLSKRSLEAEASRCFHGRWRRLWIPIF